MWDCCWELRAQRDKANLGVHTSKAEILDLNKGDKKRFLKKFTAIVLLIARGKNKGINICSVRKMLTLSWYNRYADISTLIEHNGKYVFSFSNFFANFIFIPIPH